MGSIWPIRTRRRNWRSSTSARSLKQHKLAAAAQLSGLGVILTSGDQRLFSRIEASGHHHIRKPFMLDQFLPLIDSVLHELEIRCVRRYACDREAAPRGRAARR